MNTQSIAFAGAGLLALGVLGKQLGCHRGSSHRMGERQVGEELLAGHLRWLRP
jgi:hypothetical protein